MSRIKKTKKEARERRHNRIRAKLFGTAKIPRLNVYRSNKHIYAQLIDDENNKIIACSSDKKIKVADTKENGDMTRGQKIAYKVGELIAEKGMKMKISKIIFDKGGYKYHGKVKSLAEGARKKGLKF